MAVSKPATIAFAWPPRQAAKPRSGMFRQDAAEEIESINNVLRGSLIAAFDESFLKGRLNRVLWQDENNPPEGWSEFLSAIAAAVQAKSQAGVWKAFETYGLTIFQAMMLAVFPEEFSEPDDPARGVIPRAGPRRVGADRLVRYAELNGIKVG